MHALRSLLLILWMWPFGAWAQDFWVGHFEDDGEEFQEVPHGLSGPPQALLIWTDRVADPVRQRGAALSWSICDAERCVGFAGDRLREELADGGFRERSRRVSHRDAIHFIGGTTADLLGWDAEHLRFGWHGDPSPGRIHILAIGGERTRARVVEWNLPETTPSGRVEVRGVGFEPDVLLSLFSDQDLSRIPDIQNGMSLKMAVATAYDRGQWTTGTATNVSGDSLVARWLLHDSFIVGGGTAAFPVYRGRLETMTPDGFVVDFPVSSGVPGAVATLALSGVRAQVGRTAGPSAPGSGTQSFSGMRFSPQAMLFRSVQAPGSDGPQAGASLGLGMTDGVRSSATAFREAPLGSVSTARALGAVHLGLFGGETGGRAELSSFTDNGFALSWDSHPGVPVDLAWLALAIDEGAAPPPAEHTLRFTRQPVDGVAGELLEAVEVTVTSEAGEPVNGAQVHLELIGGDGISLLGTLAVPTIEGVARFADLVVDGAATELRLRARVLEGAAVESEAFSVRAADEAPLGPAQYRIACGCGAAGPEAALGWAALLLLLWGRTTLQRPRTH